jgi:hypothetical protein
MELQHWSSKESNSALLSRNVFLAGRNVSSLLRHDASETVSDISSTVEGSVLEIMQAI